MLFGLALIAAIAAEDMLKGLIAGAFGLMLGAMGADHIYATPRGTFGFLELFDGVPLVPALIGLFAISEALVMLEQSGSSRSATAMRDADAGARPSQDLRSPSATGG